MNAHAHSIQIMTTQRYKIEIKILLEMTRIFRIFLSFFFAIKSIIHSTIINKCIGEEEKKFEQ